MVSEKLNTTTSTMKNLQRQPAKKEEQGKKELAQHKGHRPYQGAWRGIRLNERAVFHNFSCEMTSMRKLIRAQRKKIVLRMKAMIILQSSITETIIKQSVKDLQVLTPIPPSTPERSPSRRVEERSTSPLQEYSPERQVRERSPTPGKEKSPDPIMELMPDEDLRPRSPSTGPSPSPEPPTPQPTDRTNSSDSRSPSRSTLRSESGGERPKVQGPRTPTKRKRSRSQTSPRRRRTRSPNDLRRRRDLHHSPSPNWTLQPSREGRSRSPKRQRAESGAYHYTTQF